MADRVVGKGSSACDLLKLRSGLMKNYRGAAATPTLFLSAVLKVIIHKRDRRFQEERSYGGSDLYPPKGEKISKS